MIFEYFSIKHSSREHNRVMIFLLLKVEEMNHPKVSLKFKLMTNINGILNCIKIQDSPQYITFLPHR